MDLRQNAKGFSPPSKETDDAAKHTAEQRQLAIAEHKTWLSLPLTKTLLRIMEEHKNRIANSIGQASMSQDKSDQYVRLLAAKLNNTQNIYDLIYDSETFIAQS